MSEALLATKLYIPPLRRDLVDRPHLLQRLSTGLAQNCRLTLISAPAGYGKSALVRQWVSQFNTPVAWLSLEKGDNAPGRFWSYFSSALRSIPGLRQAGVGELVSHINNRNYRGEWHIRPKKNAAAMGGVDVANRAHSLRRLRLPRRAAVPERHAGYSGLSRRRVVLSGSGE